jgi:hypothetical protein
MASIRAIQRVKGTVWRVDYQVDGERTSLTFEEPETAERYLNLVETVGGNEAHRIITESSERYS